MKADIEFYSALEDIIFKYERMEAMVSVLRQFLSEGCVDIIGAPENSISYSLYEIEMGLHDNNEKIREVRDKGEVLKEKKTA